MSVRRYGLRILLVALFALAFIRVGALPTTTTYTGRVGDAMCGAEHVMGNSAECTRICIQHGSRYALIINDKAYTVDTQNKVLLNQLNELAGQKIALRGILKGMTIEARSLIAVK